MHYILERRYVGYVWMKSIQQTKRERKEKVGSIVCENKEGLGKCEGRYEKRNEKLRHHKTIYVLIYRTHHLLPLRSIL